MKRMALIAVVVLVLATTVTAAAQGSTTPPGLYVTNLAINPDPPARGVNLNFAATFLNTAAGDQNLKWVVLIYRADSPAKSYGQTSIQFTTFAPGIGDQAALGSWKLDLGGPCDYFFARVALVDNDNQRIPLTKPDGTPFEKGFTVCPPSELPAFAPQATAVPTVIPVPQPGVFVTDLRLAPGAVRNTDVTFYPTFTNNATSTFTFKWRVFIFRADAPMKSYAETTYLLSSFPVGTGEQLSDGRWKLGPGDCEPFFARVGWVDSLNQIQYLLRPSGEVFEKGFTMCMPG